MGKHDTQKMVKKRWLKWRGVDFNTRRSFFDLHPDHSRRLCTCPACGYPTLASRAGYDYCSLCHWEDDGQDDPHADEAWGGPNDHSLTQARANFEITCCVWSFEERSDFSRWNEATLFDERMIASKRRLRAAYEALMSCDTPARIYDQWHAIDALWQVHYELRDAVESEVDEMMRKVLNIRDE
ncbi:MAG: CPCC family cysteine-rich protein [Thiobacillus sp.]